MRRSECGIAEDEPLLGLALVRELRRAANGRPILFSGDSVTRQLFLRLVWMIRSPTPDSLPAEMNRTVAEHYFHSDATYVVTRDGDLLVPHYDHSNDTIPACDAKLMSREDVLLAVCFVWDPFQELATRTVDALAMLQPNAVVHIVTLQWFQLATGKGKHKRPIHPHAILTQLRMMSNVFMSSDGVQAVEKLAAVRRPTAELRMMEERAFPGTRNANATMRLVLISVPDIALGKSRAKHGVYLVQRNAVLKGWVQWAASTFRDTPVRVSLLDWAAHPVAINSTRCDFVHFMCTGSPALIVKYDGRVLDRIEWMRSPCGACTDAPDVVLLRGVMGALLASSGNGTAQPSH